MTRRLTFNKFGLAEDPRGYFVTWTVGERTYLAEVVGVVRDEVRGIVLLKTKHFNGEPAPDVAAAVVEVISASFDEPEREKDAPTWAGYPLTWGDEG